MKITRVGVDLAKSVFQVHGVDRHGKAIFKTTGPVLLVFAHKLLRDFPYGSGAEKMIEAKYANFSALKCSLINPSRESGNASYA